MLIRHNLLTQLLGQLIFWAVAIPVFSHSFSLAIPVALAVSLPITMFVAHKLVYLKCM